MKKEKSTEELTAMFDSDSKSISTHTMQREFKGLGLNNHVAVRKPLISEANWKKRHKDWTLEQWKKVMWPGESRFTLLPSDGRIRARREVDEAMHPLCLVPNVQACGGSVMIWGCFSWSSLGPATLCAQKMRSAAYLDILNDWMMNGFFLPWWQRHIPGSQCHDSLDRTKSCDIA